MLPGVDFTEMLLLVVLALVLLGPRELPLMMRKIGRFTGKMRAMAFEFRQGFDELGRQAELEELRKEVATLKKTVGMEDLQRELDEDQRNMEKDIASAMSPATVKPQLGQAVPVPAAGVEPRPDAPPADAPKTSASKAEAAAEPAPSRPSEAGEDFQIDAGHSAPAKQDAST